MIFAGLAGFAALLVVGCATAPAVAAARASAICPDGIAIGETTEGETVCERLDGTGDLIFLNADGSEQRRVAKSYSGLFDRNASQAYLGFTKAQWGTSSGPDVLGNALISRSSPGDPSCESSCPAYAPVVRAVREFVPSFGVRTTHRELAASLRAPSTSTLKLQISDSVL